MRIRTLLIIGAIGNILCWIGDVLLSVFPGATSGLAVDPVWEMHLYGDLHFLRY